MKCDNVTTIQCMRGGENMVKLVAAQGLIYNSSLEMGILQVLQLLGQMLVI